MNRTSLFPMIQALLAALLFGASAPFAKLLLGEVEPIFLASFLYLGSGIGLLGLKAAQSAAGRSQAKEAGIGRKDAGWLLGAVMAGGIAAPIVLLFALRETPAATASLLLNFEGVATALIAALVFKEAVSRRAAFAIVAITLGSILVSLDPGQKWGISLGALGILLACTLWGLDNNFTRNISAKDPLVIVTIKGLGAGLFSFLLAGLLGNRLPAAPVMLGAMVLGCFSYGVSIVLFIRAMRRLGAARTSALFSTAPLAGIAFAFILFNEMPKLLFLVAASLMFAGALLLVSEEHKHSHFHKFEAHEHQHCHDDNHHEHAHAGSPLPASEHSHPHEHPLLEHEHDHMPDTHHRHAHE